MVQVTASTAADGVTGEYRPQPVALEVPRLRSGGFGVAGIDVTGVDGPGTRMTVFLSGCPLRCLYCHNPDTMFAAKGQPVRLDDLVNRLKRYRMIFRTTGGGLTVSGG